MSMLTKVRMVRKKYRNVAKSSNENEKSEAQRILSENALPSSTGYDHKKASDHSEDSVGSDRSNDLNLLADATREAEVPTEGRSTSGGTADSNSSSSSDSRLSVQGEVVKIFRTFLKKYERHFSLLVGALGREAAADKVASEKRAGMNVELRKLPNLILRARLDAAAFIVSDPAKLYLFTISLKMKEVSGYQCYFCGLI